MRVFISGASGFLGSELMRVLRAAGHEPLALVRRAPQGDEVQWDPEQPLHPARLADADAVVHLAGKNVAGRWTEEFKRELLHSRVQGTKTLATAAAESYRRVGRPHVFVAASGVGYYGNRGDEVLTEESGPGSGFLADISRQWEAASDPARDAGVRVVNLRIGVVLAKHGGALKPLLLPFRMGLGGRIGSGRQYWSWVSLDDVVGAMLFALENEGLAGPVNAVGPAPATNEEFVDALGRVLHRPTIFPFPEFAVRAVLGEMGEQLLLMSERVMPAKLQRAGYVFWHPELKGALRAALGQR